MIEALWSLIIYYRKFLEKWKISLEIVFHLVYKVKQASRCAAEIDTSQETHKHQSARRCGDKHLGTACEEDMWSQDQQASST